MKVTNREWENGKVKGQEKNIARKKKGENKIRKKESVIGKEDTKRQVGKKN